MFSEAAVITSVTACIVELSLRKPYWFEARIECLQVKESSLVNINFSKILEKHDSMEIGR